MQQRNILGLSHNILGLKWHMLGLYRDSRTPVLNDIDRTERTKHGTASKGCQQAGGCDVVYRGPHSHLTGVAEPCYHECDAGLRSEYKRDPLMTAFKMPSVDMEGTRE